MCFCIRWDWKSNERMSGHILKPFFGPVAQLFILIFFWSRNCGPKGRAEPSQSKRWKHLWTDQSEAWRRGLMRVGGGARADECETPALGRWRIGNCVAWRKLPHFTLMPIGWFHCNLNFGPMCLLLIRRGKKTHCWLFLLSTARCFLIQRCPFWVKLVQKFFLSD